MLRNGHPKKPNENNLRCGGRTRTRNPWLMRPSRYLFFTPHGKYTGLPNYCKALA